MESPQGGVVDSGPWAKCRTVDAEWEYHTRFNMRSRPPSLCSKSESQTPHTKHGMAVL